MRRRVVPALSVRTIVLISCAVSAVYLTLIGIEAAHSRAWTHRWVSDDFDRDVFYDIAQFLPAAAVPYLDVRSEYPPVATMAFAAPLLISPGWHVSREAYRFRWSAGMAAVLVTTIYLLAWFRVSHDLNPIPVLLLLLPSPLYFSLMRFDILCALVLCASLAAFARGRYRLAHALLGVATFVKWYPALAFPVYVAFHLAHERAPIRLSNIWRSETIRYGSVYVATVVVVVLASIAAFTWEGVLVPYRFHAGRGGQYFNLYWLLEQYRGPLRIDDSGWQIVKVIFFALQFSIIPVLLSGRVRSLADVFRYVILAIYLFVTFSRIDSPQWILWYMVPALMFVGDARVVGVLAFLAVWNYVVFPVAFDALDMASPTFSAIVFVKDLAVLAVIIGIFRDGHALERTRLVARIG